MMPSQYFYKVYSKNYLSNIFYKKIANKSNIGMDRISPVSFKKSLNENIDIISRKVLSGTYEFTRYREVLISKGRGKTPRVISIPTIRDKLTLCACHDFLQKSFDGYIEEPLLHTIISDITKEIFTKQYDGFVKIDITSFYASINHELLFKKIKRRIRKKEALRLLSEAISTNTIASSGYSSNTPKKECGVPEGLSISNILADIYLSDFEKEVQSKYNVSLYRYVDDILILCPKINAKEIKKDCVDILKNDYKLEANENKTTYGKILDGVPFLGYMFYDNKVGIRLSSIEKLEGSIEELFRLRKNKSISENVFLLRLNIRITGCIFEAQKYGWLFYYSQLTDLQVLYHLDWLVDRLFKRYKYKKPKDLKKFIRTYHEITKNVSNSTYLFNADRYSIQEKIDFLLKINTKISFDKKDISLINDLFSKAIFKEVQRLEHDIQNFS